MPLQIPAGAHRVRLERTLADALHYEPRSQHMIENVVPKPGVATDALYALHTLLSAYYMYVECAD